MVYSLQAEPPTLSSPPPRPQAFLVNSPPNHHKLLIQTTSSPPTSFLAHVTPTQDPSQPIMCFVEETLSVSDNILELLSTGRHIGSVASDALDRFRATCRENTPPRKPEGGQDTEAERLRRARIWVRETVDLLMERGILQPPGIQTSAHRVPRHHHTQYCTHQRLHCHHPYRRRARQQAQVKAGMLPAATVLER